MNQEEAYRIGQELALREFIKEGNYIEKEAWISALAQGGMRSKQLAGICLFEGGSDISLGLVRAVPVAFLSCQFGEEFLLTDQTYPNNS